MNIVEFYIRFTCCIFVLMIAWGIGIPFVILNAVAIDNFNNGWLLFKVGLVTALPMAIAFWIIHPVLKHLDKK